MLGVGQKGLVLEGRDIGRSEEGVEVDFAINYLANFHLLGILSPAIRAQPPDREVRIVVGTCSSYLGGKVVETMPVPGRGRPNGVKEERANDSSALISKQTSTYGSSKLALMTFAIAFQKHLTSYPRPDKHPPNARVFLVDPGWSRTPGMRRHLSSGSLFGLALYLILYPFWWLVLKSADQGAETFLYAAMDGELARAEGGILLKECAVRKIMRDEVFGEEKQKRLWEVSENAIEVLEKEGAISRATERKRREEEEKVAKRDEEREKENERKPGSRRSRKDAAAVGDHENGRVKQ